MPMKAMTFLQRRTGEGHRPADTRLTAAQRGYDRDWQQLRDRHIQEHPLCVECLKLRRTRAAEIVDHIKPLAAGGPRLDPNNLRSLCRLCHGLITGNFLRTGVNEMPRLAHGFAIEGEY